MLTQDFEAEPKLPKHSVILLSLGEDHSEDIPASPVGFSRLGTIRGEEAETTTGRPVSIVLEGGPALAHPSAHDR